MIRLILWELMCTIHKLGPTKFGETTLPSHQSLSIRWKSQTFKNKSTCILASIIPSLENVFKVPLGRTGSSCCSPRRLRGESPTLLRFLYVHISSCLSACLLSSLLSSHLYSCIYYCLSSWLSSLSSMFESFSFSSRGCFSISKVCIYFLLLLVIGNPLYSSSFNSFLSFVLFELIFCFFNISFRLFFVFGEFIFLLLELVFLKTFLVLL